MLTAQQTISKLFETLKLDGVALIANTPSGLQNPTLCNYPLDIMLNEVSRAYGYKTHRYKGGTLVFILRSPHTPLAAQCNGANACNLCRFQSNILVHHGGLVGPSYQARGSSVC